MRGLNDRIKSVIAHLPASLQQRLRSVHFALQIRLGRFQTNEIEFSLMSEWLGRGDWAMDIGANIGHYTFRMSQLVGPEGRVIAFEPVPETFEILTRTAARSGSANVTLINAAVSSQAGLVSLKLPTFDTGLRNYYQAQVARNGGDVNVLSLAVDDLALPHVIRVIKIDVEGHESHVLRGMSQLLKRDRPILIVEGVSPEIAGFLATFGYKGQHLQGSSNTIYQV